MRTFLWLFVALIVLAGVIAFAVFGNWAAVSDQWGKGAYASGIFLVGEAIFAAAAVLALVYQQLSRRSKGFYFAWARFLNWLRPGRSPTWDVQARLAGSGPQEVLNELESQLRDAYSGRTNTLTRLDNYRVLVVDGRFNVELRHVPEAETEEPDGCSLLVRIFALTVPFSEATSVLRDDVLSILNRAASAIGARADDQSYALTISFPTGTNPFLPAYVEQLHPEDVLSFQLALKMARRDADPGEQVDLSANSLTIRAQSLQVLQAETEAFAQLVPRRS